jgi:hypothetical protein
MHDKPKWFPWALVVFGVLFLLQNLGVWNFWNIQWYTTLFLLFGIAHIGGCCKTKK